MKELCSGAGAILGLMGLIFTIVFVAVLPVMLAVKLVVMMAGTG